MVLVSACRASVWVALAGVTAPPIFLQEMTFLRAHRVVQVGSPTRSSGQSVRDLCWPTVIGQGWARDPIWVPGGRQAG